MTTQNSSKKLLGECECECEHLLTMAENGTGRPGFGKRFVRGNASEQAEVAVGQARIASN